MDQMKSVSGIKTKEMYMQNIFFLEQKPPNDPPKDIISIEFCFLSVVLEVDMNSWNLKRSLLWLSDEWASLKICKQ